MVKTPPAKASRPSLVRISCSTCRRWKRSVCPAHRRRWERHRAAVSVLLVSSSRRCEKQPSVQNIGCSPALPKEHLLFYCMSWVTRGFPIIDVLLAVFAREAPACHSWNRSVLLLVLRCPALRTHPVENDSADVSVISDDVNRSTPHGAVDPADASVIPDNVDPATPEIRIILPTLR